MLEEATRLTDVQRLAMDRHGRTLVEERYSWQQVAEKMQAVYAWLLDEGPLPEPCAGTRL